MHSSGKEVGNISVITPQEHLLIGSIPRLSLGFQYEPDPVIDIRLSYSYH